MRILLWHGWLLWGSGSNVYTASLAREWRKQGHDVLVLCQDPHADHFQFVDAWGRFSPDNQAFDLTPTRSSPGTGKCQVALPDIGELLPVFVYNEYPGFKVKTFIEMTDDELDRYVTPNVAAMQTAIRWHRPDVTIVGHEVMAPFIASQACMPLGCSYAAQLHGSGLEYAVKMQERYRRFAIDGLTAAGRVIGGSRYMVSAALAAAPGWEDKARVVNLGCDVDIFQPRARDESAPFTVGFVGGLIENKGVQNLLAALPLVEVSPLRVVIVGDGRYRGQLEQQWEDIRSRDARAKDIQLRFAGHLDHDALAATLPGFDALVVPSTLPEAFGLVAAEAAACGVLPIVPDHSGIGEVGAAIEEHLGRPGLLTFQSLEPVASLAASINRIAGLPDAERQQMENDASDLARERWSWEVVGARLLEAALP